MARINIEALIVIGESNLGYHAVVLHPLKDVEHFVVDEQDIINDLELSDDEIERLPRHRAHDLVLDEAVAYCENGPLDYAVYDETVRDI